jgi:hypothetical protein
MSALEPDEPISKPQRNRPIARPLRYPLVLLALCLMGAYWITDRPGTAVGRVVEHETGAPIPGARVGVKGMTRRVSSDDQGHFRLPLPRAAGHRIVAWKHGYYIAAGARQPDGTTIIRLSAHPQEDSAEYEWLDPNPNPMSEHNCANCHVEIYRQWAASSHALSALNRHFLDMFDGGERRSDSDDGWNFSRHVPDARAVCVACHLPSVTADDPVAESPRAVSGIAREGIHCDFCHKIADVEQAYVGWQHGRDAMRIIRPARGRQVFFGPLDDVDRGHDTYAPIYRSSQYCASCHEGTLFGIRVYETYSEWKSSSYARRGIECQHCHMKPDGVMRNFAPGHGGIARDSSTLATHQFPGASDREFLKDSVRLDLTASVHDQFLEVTTTVRPVQVGHRLPTGTPERHLLLLVQAATEDGRQLALHSGPRIPPPGGVGLPQRGNYAGMPGKLYGKLLEGIGGESPVPFWRAVQLSEDTRLDPDRPDACSFRFQLVGSFAKLRVEAKLIYRRFYKPILEAKGWPDQDVLLAEQAAEVWKDEGGRMKDESELERSIPVRFASLPGNPASLEARDSLRPDVLRSDSSSFLLRPSSSFILPPPSSFILPPSSFLLHPSSFPVVSFHASNEQERDVIELCLSRAELDDVLPHVFGQALGRLGVVLPHQLFEAAASEPFILRVCGIEHAVGERHDDVSEHEVCLSFSDRIIRFQSQGLTVCLEAGHFPGAGAIPDRRRVAGTGEVQAAAGHTQNRTKHSGEYIVDRARLKQGVIGAAQYAARRR